MTFTAEQIAIGSSAAVVAGNTPVTDFSGQGVGETLAAIYEAVVRAELGERRFKWAQKQQQLSREVAVPAAGWEASYAKPADVVEIETVLDAGADVPIDYEVYEGHIFCNAGANDVIVMKYIFRADESMWPPQFRYGVIMMLAGHIAASVEENMDKASEFWNRAEQRFVRAGFHSSQGSTTRGIARKGRIRSARYGRR